MRAESFNCSGKSSSICLLSVSGDKILGDGVSKFVVNHDRLWSLRALVLYLLFGAMVGRPGPNGRLEQVKQTKNQ